MHHGDREALDGDQRVSRQIGHRASRQHASDERANDAVVAALTRDSISRAHHDGDREENPVAMPLVAERLRDQRASHHRQRQASRKSQHRRIGAEMRSKRARSVVPLRDESGKINVADRGPRRRVVRQRLFEASDVTERPNEPPARGVERRARFCIHCIRFDLARLRS